MLKYFNSKQTVIIFPFPFLFPFSNGVRVKGYYIWSLFDNYEWAEGYSSRFGIFFVDFENGRFTRFPKNSAIWWMNFLGQKFKIPSKKKARPTDEDGEGSVKRLRAAN